MEAAVVAELESLPAAELRPGLAALALALAREIDDRNFTASHASLGRELQATGGTGGTASLPVGTGGTGGLLRVPGNNGWM